MLASKVQMLHPQASLDMRATSKPRNKAFLARKRQSSSIPQHKSPTSRKRQVTSVRPIGVDQILVTQELSHLFYDGRSYHDVSNYKDYLYGERPMSMRTKLEMNRHSLLNNHQVEIKNGMGHTFGIIYRVPETDTFYVYRKAPAYRRQVPERTEVVHRLFGHPSNEPIYRHARIDKISEDKMIYSRVIGLEERSTEIGRRYEPMYVAVSKDDDTIHYFCTERKDKVIARCKRGATQKNCTFNISKGVAIIAVSALEQAVFATK